ncbi:MAG: DUF1254 domain-containing protein [Hyphomonadaceae bacterium]
MRRRDVLRGASALGILGLAGCASAPETGPLPLNEVNIERAFLYAYPLYEISRTGQNRAAAPGLNRIGNRATLTDASMRQITAPNNDTIYTSAQLELSGGPVEVIAPTDTHRYFNITFMDAFTDNSAGIGTRLTHGQGGKFWIAGPQWSGSAPADVTVFRSSTNDVWMLGRIVVDGPDDLAAAKALQSQIALRPTADALPRPFKVKCTSPEDPENFLAVINEMIARSPGSEGHLSEVGLYKTLGITRDPEFKPSPELIAAWRAYLPKGMAKLREAFQFKQLISDGWSYQAAGVGERTASDLTRSAIALGGLAALPEAEAMYFHALFEAGGDRLTGERKYVFRVPPGGIPVDAFWSLTMYQPEDDGRFFFTPNPINRYSVGDRTAGLVKNADGSIDILIQHDQPTGAQAANWLPAPAGPLRLALRAYLPRAELRERKWKVPALVRV